MAAFRRSLAHDLRYALRNLRRHPAFSIAAVLLLAVGTGGTTLVFSVVDAILLRELPVKAPSRLARIVELTHNRPPVSEYPYRVFDQFRHSSRSFRNVFAQSEVDIAYADGQSSRPVRAQIVTGNYYSTLGVEPLRGRLFSISLSRLHWFLAYNRLASCAGSEATFSGATMVTGPTFTVYPGCVSSQLVFGIDEANQNRAFAHGINQLGRGRLNGQHDVRGGNKLRRIFNEDDVAIGTVGEAAGLARAGLHVQPGA